MQQVLYLRRLRDFGEKISDTFLFLKQNWKKLFGIYAVFVVPFIIAAIVMAIFFADHIYSSRLSNPEALNISDFLSVELLVIVLCLLLAGTSYNTAVYSYFRLYDEQKGEQPTLQQVGQVFFSKFFKVFVYNIFVTLLLVVIAIIPVIIVVLIPLLGILAVMLIAIIFMVILFYLNCIYVVEEIGFSGGISRLFHLFGGRWWNVIGFTIVVFLIYYVFSFVIQFAAMMVMGLFSISFFTPHASRTEASGHHIISILVLLFGLMLLLQQIFYLIVFSGVGINYYSLAEEKDGSAIEAQIESIGDGTDQYGGIEEQY